MSRLSIGLATVMWLGMYALGAQESSQVPKWFPTAMKPAAEKTTDASPVPAPVMRDQRAGSAPTWPVAPATRAVADLRSVASEKGGAWQTRVVLRLCNAPAIQLANTITNLFSAEQRTARIDAVSNAVIVPDVISNCLLVSGSTEAVDEVRKLVAELDRAAVMIRLDIVMGDVPTASIPAAEPGAQSDQAKVQIDTAGGAELRKQMEVLFQAQLTTLDNQPAHLQMGRHAPTISADSMSGNPPQQNNCVTPQNVGTIVALTPRASADRVVTMQLDVEDSRLAPAEEGAPIFVPSKGEPVRAPVVETFTVKTTLKIADGQTVVLGGMARQPKNGKQRVILVTPHVLSIGGESQPAK